MRIFYAELDVGSNASMLIGNNNCLVRPIRQEYIFSIKGIKIHFQFVCVNKGIFRVRAFP